ncbi:hypothetical protein FNV43_RR02648 [Rhamnella rubrinervis]|uniref:RNase H type-1 domain-containing protein n=1 Tax=Rhamnella rubrinervis TaxID=2594499 RepID=A0A8K0MT59_9ROSA|nr:hypothetical protein FNV43_RR02648 [Rhamnella rubrinervis]
MKNTTKLRIETSGFQHVIDSRALKRKRVAALLRMPDLVALHFACLVESNISVEAPKLLEANLSLDDRYMNEASYLALVHRLSNLNLLKKLTLTIRGQEVHIFLKIIRKKCASQLPNLKHLHVKDMSNNHFTKTLELQESLLCAAAASIPLNYISVTECGFCSSSNRAEAKATLFYTIWIGRCKFFFNGGVNLYHLIIGINCSVEEFTEAGKKEGISSSSTEDHDLMNWRPPQQGFLKVNVDAALANTTAAAAMVVRDEHGNVLLLASKLFTCNSAFDAEVEALGWAAAHADSCGWRKVECGIWRMEESGMGNGCKGGCQYN